MKSIVSHSLVRCIGIDIGGTSTKAAVLDGEGTVLFTHSLPTCHGPQGVIATAREAIGSIIDVADMRLADISLIGIGIPGAVDQVAGTVRHAKDDVCPAALVIAIAKNLLIFVAEIAVDSQCLLFFAGAGQVLQPFRSR